MIRYLRWKLIIEKSGLFDYEYYLFTYPDVRIKDVDPILHYLRYGAKEGRNPSKEFDTKYYYRRNQDVLKSDINPLVHYILHGIGEGRLPKSTFNINAKQKNGPNQ
jgi:hypothetical protein